MTKLVPRRHKDPKKPKSELVIRVSESMVIIAGDHVGSQIASEIQRLIGFHHPNVESERIVA